MANNTAAYEVGRAHVNHLVQIYSAQQILAKAYVAELARMCSNTAAVAEAKVRRCHVQSIEQAPNRACASAHVKHYCIQVLVM